MERFTALVLAGRRGGADPLAQASGASHRALVPVAGVPMLLRVVRALRAAPRVTRLVVSIEEPELLAKLPELERLRAEGALALHRSLPSPSRSVLDVLGGLGPDERLLVVTADHALLTPEIVEAFAGAGEAGEADLLVALVAASRVRARFPESKRTWIRLRGEGYSGANLFAFRTPRARRAAEFWVRAEAFRKRPWQLARAFGPLSLLLFVLRRLDLEATFERASRAIGARIAPVPLPFAEAAVDVDRASDLALAERVLRERA